MSFKIFKIHKMRQINLCTGLILTPLMLFGLSHSAMAATPQNPQFSSSKAIYAGRTQPEPAKHDYYYPHHGNHVGHAPYDHGSYHRVIKQSSGYYQQTNPQQIGHQPSSQPNRYPSHGSHVSANIYYQAPTTTAITRQVQIIPPQNSVGDVYYSQDTYYLSTPQPVYRPYYQRPYQPLIPMTANPKDTESRSKQWTDTSDFNR